MKKAFIMITFLLVCGFIKAQTSTIKHYVDKIEFCHQSGDTTELIMANVERIEVVRNSVEIRGNENVFYVRAADYGYASAYILRQFLGDLISNNLTIVANKATKPDSLFWLNGTDTLTYQIQTYKVGTDSLLRVGPKIAW